MQSVNPIGLILRTVESENICVIDDGILQLFFIAETRRSISPIGNVSPDNGAG